MLTPVAILLVLTSLLPTQEPASGIYITQTPPRKVSCDNESRMFIGKLKVCLSKKPIIRKEEVKYASEIKYDPVYKTHYIELRLSSPASLTLRKTVSSLPKSQFAFALDGDVICIFSIQHDLPIQGIRIGEDVALSDLTLIEERLKKMKF